MYLLLRSRRRGRAAGRHGRHSAAGGDRTRAEIVLKEKDAWFQLLHWRAGDSTGLGERARTVREVAGLALCKRWSD